MNAQFKTTLKTMAVAVSAACALGAASTASAQISGDVVKIGFITDLSGQSVVHLAPSPRWVLFLLAGGVLGDPQCLHRAGRVDHLLPRTPAARADPACRAPHDEAGRRPPRSGRDG